VTGILFADIGKGWNNGESPDDQRQRQDAGIGVEFELDLVGQVSFPIRIEIAQPYNDPEYHRTQYIFFQALAFF
jgi:hemolysin activation/secretion protein